MPDVSEQDSNGTLAGLPQWARLTAVFGFPTVLAGFLVWRIIAGVEVAVADTHRATERTQQLMLDHIERSDAAMITLQQGVTRVLEQHTGLLRQICISNAQSESQQRECVR